MAGHLQQQGLPVTVYNRNQNKTLRWHNEYHGQFASSAKTACADADFVMVCVGNDDDLRQICYGPHGILAGLKNGAVLIDHTTTSVEVAREIAMAWRRTKHLCPC